MSEYKQTTSLWGIKILTATGKQAHLPFNEYDTWTQMFMKTYQEMTPRIQIY